MKLRILTEMPFQYHLGGEFSTKKVNGILGRFTADTAKAYSSPKFYEILSKKLSGYSGRNLIFLGGVYFKKQTLWAYVDNQPREIAKDKKSLSSLTGIPESTFDKSITLILTNDNDQPQLSPWLLLHQLAEEILMQDPHYKSSGGQEFWEYIIYPRYERSLKLLSKSPRDPNPDFDHIFVKLFKMKSARDNTVTDYSAELITEFLWHHGRIRINYDCGIDRKILDNIKNDIENHINSILDLLTGKIMLRT